MDLNCICLFIIYYYKKMDQNDFFSRDFNNTSTVGSTFESLNKMSQNDFIHEKMEVSSESPNQIIKIIKSAKVIKF